MKLYYRNALIWNLIYFLVVSIVFLYIVNIIGLSQSPFVFKSLESFLIETKFLVAYAILLIFSFIYNIKYSRYLFLSFGLVSIGYSFNLIYLNFSKISITLLSFYILVFYYFYQLLVIEINKPYTRSGVDRRFIFNPMLKRIILRIKLGEGSYAEGYLLNWDHDSCYLRLVDKNLPHLKDKVDIEANLAGYQLRDRAIIITKNVIYQEVGLKFEQEDSPVGWRHFSDIMDMLGYKPEYLK